MPPTLEFLSNDISWSIGTKNNLKFLKTNDSSINNLDISNNFRFDISKVTIDSTNFKSNIDASFLKHVDISNLTVNNNLIVNNESTFKNQVDICNGLLVTGDASFNNNVTILGNLTVEGNFVKQNVETLIIQDPVIMIDPSGIDENYNSKGRGIGFTHGTNDPSFGFFGYYKHSYITGFLFTDDINHTNFESSNNLPEAQDIRSNVLLYGKAKKVDVRNPVNYKSGPVIYHYDDEQVNNNIFLYSKLRRANEDILLDISYKDITHNKHIVNKEYVDNNSRIIYNADLNRLKTIVKNTSGELLFNDISGYKIFIPRITNAINDLSIKLTFKIGYLISWEADQNIDFYILRDHSTNDISNQQLTIESHQLTKKISSGIDISICSLNIGTGNAAGPLHSVWNFQYVDDLSDNGATIDLSNNYILYQLSAKLTGDGWESGGNDISSGIIGYDEITIKNKKFKQINSITAEIVNLNG